MNRILSIVFIATLSAASASAQPQHTGLYVEGRRLWTPCGDNVVLRGVNKMVIWTDDLNVRKQTYAEIRKTGANAVRIVWLANPSPFEQDSGPDGLDRTIQDCIDSDMIPIVELHDATGDWSQLPAMVDYWVRPDVVAVIKKHEKYLIVNIANECGDESVTAQEFEAGYRTAVTRMRTAGIRTPLVIDASEWGKNLAVLDAAGPALIQHDPDHNLLFSVHTYWPLSQGADEQFITSRLEASAAIHLPLIVGEFAWKFNLGDKCEEESDYKTIIRVCDRLDIGWLAWEWGPGNEFADPTCDILNMTASSTYATLKEGWAKEVAVTSPYSIANTSVTPMYVINAGICDPSDIGAGPPVAPGIRLGAYPNPFRSEVALTLTLDRRQEGTVSVYSILGQRLAVLDSGPLNAGSRTYLFSPGADAMGWLYYCVAETEDGTVTAGFSGGR